jgi:ligand-binding sensor domain-containing protein/signal transduction histidine kinase
VGIRLSVIVCGVVLLVGAPPVRAERLTLKVYTTVDGLANNSVSRVVADSRGFLWFCTGDGLSRFDGYTFTNYGRDEGLPSAMVNDLLETRAGVYWIATDAGLVRLNPLGASSQSSASQSSVAAADAAARFTTYAPNTFERARHIRALFEDAAGTLWVGTMQGLYRASADAHGGVSFTFDDIERHGPARASAIAYVTADRRGGLWVAAATGLYRRSSDGRIDQVESTWLTQGVQRIFEDRDGTIWVGTRDFGLLQVRIDPASDRPHFVRAYSRAEGLSRWVTDIAQTPDGTLWAGTNDGLLQLVATTPDAPWRGRIHSGPEGIRDEVWALAVDRARNLWIGRSAAGAAKLRYRGISTFDAADGLAWARWLLETNDGDLIVLGGVTAERGASLRRYDGRMFVSLGWLRGKVSTGWSWHQCLLQDRAGDWWIGTGEGVFRFDRKHKIDDIARVPATRRYTTRDGLSSNSVMALHEDARGDVWIATEGPHGLARWERRTNTFHHYPEIARDGDYVASIAEDAAGHVWIGFAGHGGLARFDGAGAGAGDGDDNDERHRQRITRFTIRDGVPAGSITNLLRDSAGRMWAATDRAGICRIDRPDAARPTFVSYTTAQGLSSNAANAIAEDRAGLIYISTGRGIDRLDPATGRFTYYSSAEGVSGSGEDALTDRRGVVWFNTLGGLVRLIPDADPPANAPPMLITGVRVGTRALPISALGERTVQPITLPFDNTQLQIDFVAPGSQPGDGTRYQYAVDEDGREWSQPSNQRTISFAGLGAGSYFVRVRAVNANGTVSPAPATLTFTVLPPLWRRWWFVAIVAATLAAAIYRLHRLRVARLLEVANMRTSIATDLHDDIGANLTRIAILSEVARQRAAADAGAAGAGATGVGATDDPVDARLAGIARIARESVNRMSDIVWAINPDRDSLADLVRKMREHVEEVFAARNLAVTFHAPEHGHDQSNGDRRPRTLKLGASVRRDVYLIFKEAVNNAARHAHCTAITITFEVDRTHLALIVADDGIGYDPSVESDGLGVISMRRRAERLGASMVMTSGPGAGTTVSLTMALSGERAAVIPRGIPGRRRPTFLGR